MRDQCIYFITDGQYIKIGVSLDPDRRMAGMQTGFANRLSMVGSFIIKGEGRYTAYDIEQELHRKLSHANVSGEWFSASIQEIDKEFWKICKKYVKRAELDKNRDIIVAARAALTYAPSSA